MPKVGKTCLSELLRKWTYGISFYTTDGSVVFCKDCEHKINCTKKCHLDQHTKTTKHKENSYKRKQASQTLLTNIKCTPNSFNTDLCQALLAAGIPWNKLECEEFRNFLKKYCINQNIPNESTLRKNYLSICYDNTILKIREDIGSSDIWISVDETTDVLGRYVANIIVGKMFDEKPAIPHLLACKILDKTNSNTIARFVNETLQILWPTGIKHENVRLMVTDAAAYMQYPDVNGLISNVKKVFVKAPLRVARFKDLLPNTQLPPEPVITRWATWLNAVFYYQENFDAIKEIISTFQDDSIAIKNAKNYLASNTVQADIAYIKSNFKVLADGIKQLETIGLPLTNSIKIIEEVKISLSHAPGKIAAMLLTKLKEVLNRNPEYLVLKELADVLGGKMDHIPNQFGINSENVVNFKFVPCSSCDVERSFSNYKFLLSDKRQSLKPEQMEKILVCYSEKLKNEKK